MSTQRTKGIVIGKFMPLHKGHMHLLDTALSGCDDLTIVVCTLKREPIPGQLRYRWVRELYPTARVVHLADDTIPQEPSEHLNFWNIWREALKRIHPEPVDFVFSSESYGERLAAELGGKHVCVDIARSNVPTSGTKVRNNPLREWDYIPAIVRPYFAKSILVTGPESCGKSTLTSMLAKHFNTTEVQEYAREYLEKISYDFDINDLNIIAARQFDACFKARQTCNKAFFSDTSAVETHIYAKHYLGESSPIIDGFLYQKWDLTLLLTPEVPWVSDNQRNLPHYRWEMYEQFKTCLSKMGHNVVVVSGNSFDNRFNSAVNAVEEKIFLP